MRKVSVLVATLLLLSLRASAGVMVESSRVIFSAGDRERSLMLSNNNDYPVIVQAWVDNGAPDGTPENAADVPVIPLPGIFRLEPGEKKYLRLLATQVKQPLDRESLYWLNIYEIPPTDAHLPANVSAVKVAIRLQLKMFWRPTNLTPSVDDVVKKLQFTLLRQPGTLQLKVTNPTPYYATFNAADIKNNAASHTLAIDMLAPFSSKTLPLDTHREEQPKSIHYALINDDGNSVENEVSFKAGK
ncbi:MULTISPECIES: molecular chaperone [Enterobacterales]|uniref:fimbrial biogenesis chaperone n=1 Tax=Enterobacterales TaxID=91347 RepID=UPI002ED873EB